MRIIKLDAIDSTNSFLRKLSLEEALDDYTVVMANHQTHGRGQMGTQWASQQSKNLTVSIYKNLSFLKIEHNFYISIVVSLSIFKALESLNINKLKIKWPNDILSDNKKIAGVLIENVIKQNQMQASVIGFGLNVNQTDFTGLPNAASLLLLTGKVYHLDEVLDLILEQLKLHFGLLEQGQLEQLKSNYEENMFRKNKPSTFKDKKNHLFSGIITGIATSGNLQVALEDNVLKEFELKEIQLLY